MTNKLAGKVAVITGASTGIGLAAAKRFIREGMDRVFITGRRENALDAAVAEIGEKATGIPGDVTSLTAVDRLYKAVKTYGRKLDVIFANAGVAQLAPFGNVDEKFFDLHFDANVKGLFFSVQKGLPFMKDGGSIILTASIASIKGFPGMSIYSAIKAAVRSFARTWTNELREPDSSQCDQSRSYRYAHYGKFAAGGGARRDERRVQESSSAGQDGGPRRDRQSGRIPRLRRGELCLRHRALRRRWCRPNLNWTFNVRAVLAEPPTSSTFRPSRKVFAAASNRLSTWPAEMNRVIGIADQAAISIGIIGWRG